MLNRQFTLIGLTNHLINSQLLDADIALQAQLDAARENISLVQHLVKNKILTGIELLQSFKKVFMLEVFDLDDLAPDWLEKSPLTAEFIRQYRIVPLKKINQILHVGISDPTNQQALDAVTFHTGLYPSPMLINEDQLVPFLNLYCESHANKHLQVNLLKQINLDNAQQTVQENIVQYDEPLIHFVNNIFTHALEKNASDIHIEPYEAMCRIRFRLHGVLQLIDEIQNPLAIRVITRIKVMAKLDIAERRLPQDGRFQFQTCDIRINTCPTLFGEKIVLRLLNSAKSLFTIDDLHFNSQQKKLFMQAIAKPQGMILVTGPTGSGKTTTLYAALNFLNQIEKNISTVEDPIEIRLDGINQVNINNKIGLSFSTILRTFLRQDPDIMMVGEIRDTETAEIAIQAAQTGHLVLSTLHTNSAIDTINRLHAMGVLAYNLASSLSLIIAQRLIRKLCPHCKSPTPNQKHFYAVGCAQCTQGYIERMAIYEFLPITSNIIKLICTHADTPTLLTTAKQEGFIALKESGMQLLRAGITSHAEINRVLQ